MRADVFLAAIVAGCGGAPAPASTPPPPPSTAPLAWLTGTYQAPGATARWQVVAGARWGVLLRDDGFEVDVLDPGGPVAGGARLIAMPDGRRADAYRVIAATPQLLEAVADPGRVRRLRTAGHALLAERDDDPPRHPERVTLTPATDTPAPALNAADAAFAADTAARGADGWVAAFAPDGAQWEDDQRIEGAAAIRAHITATLAAGALAWSPIASGARGDLGFTLGEWTFTAPTKQIVARGSYCTIWRRQPDGRWLVAFDVGRPAQT
jgi:ketosteroid isomerase-like protein